MMRIIMLGVMAAIVAWCVFLYRLGGWRWVGCFLLTAAIGGVVSWYAFLPSDGGVSAAKIVRLLGGPILAGAIAGIPAVSWFVVSLVHPRGTRGGHVYAVVYSVLMGLCFIPAGMLAAAIYFPTTARKVLGRVADALPGRTSGT
jgi:hypothetical protein